MPNPENTIFDPDSLTTYEPWTDGELVGFKATRGKQVRFLYLIPARGSDDGVASVSVHCGEHGTPSSDPMAARFDTWDTQRLIDGNRRLNDDEVREIRASSAEHKASRGTRGETQTMLAKRFGVSQQTISKIVSRQLWGNLEG